MMKKYEGKLIMRPASLEHIQDIQNIASACDIDEFGTDEFVINMQEVLESIPMETNSWVVTTEDDKIIGHAFMEEMGEGRLDTYVFTHPEYKGLGVGTLLVKCTEERANEYIEKYKEKQISYEFNNVIPAENEAAKNILEEQGYKFKRLYSQMSIELDKEPDEVILPEDVTIKKWSSNEDFKSIYKVYCEAFKDARSHRPKPYEEWLNHKTKDAGDFNLWYMAYYKGDLAGFLIGKIEGEYMWVDLLGVSRSARKHGIGRNLLKTIMKESYRRSIYKVALSVDADSPTNAHKLYKSIGMKPAFQIAMYEKQNI